MCCYGRAVSSARGKGIERHTGHSTKGSFFALFVWTNGGVGIRGIARAGGNPTFVFVGTQPVGQHRY